MSLSKLQGALTRINASPYVKAARRGLPLISPLALLKEFKWYYLKAGRREQSRPSLRLVMAFFALTCLGVCVFCYPVYSGGLLCAALLGVSFLPLLGMAWEEFKRYALGKETWRKLGDDFDALIRRVLRDYADAQGLNDEALAALEKEYSRQGAVAFKDGEIRAVWRSASAMGEGEAGKRASPAAASRPGATGAGERARFSDDAHKDSQEGDRAGPHSKHPSPEVAQDADTEGKDKARAEAKKDAPRKPSFLNNLVALGRGFTLTLLRRAGLKSRPATVSARADVAEGKEGGASGQPSLSALVIASPSRYLYEALHTYVDLGEGFNWTSEDTEEALRILDPRRVRAEGGQDAGESAARSLQLLGQERFRPLYATRVDLRTHCVVFGSTGAGKTHFLLYRIAQAVLHGETVFILDPKSDRNLREAIPRICELCGRKEDFAVVDLCDVKGSARFNPIADRVRNLEISERLTAHLPTDGASLSFKQKSQQAIEAAVDLLTLRGKPLTVLAIYALVSDLSAFTRELNGYFREYVRVKGKDDPELSVFGTRIFGELYAGMGSDPAGNAAQGAQERDSRGATASGTSASSLTSKAKSTGNAPVKRGVLLKTLRAFFDYGRGRGHFGELLGTEENREPAYLMLERVFTVASMAPDYYPKVAGAALPLLGKLSSGDLSRLFSAETLDWEAKRGEVLNASRAIGQKRVLYFSLHCLIDADLGSGVGRLILSELRSVAGLNALRIARGQKCASPVSVFIDEASEVACESLIQLLNKSRSSGFSITLASQTSADWEASTGRRTALSQILGNCNTLVSFRVLDEETSQTVERALPRATQLVRSSTIGFAESFGGVCYSGTRSLSEETAPLFPSSLLMRLPSLEFVARLPEGRVIKGRVPVLKLRDGNAGKDAPASGTVSDAAPEAKPAVKPESGTDIRKESGKEIRKEVRPAFKEGEKGVRREGRDVSHDRGARVQERDGVSPTRGVESHAPDEARQAREVRRDLKDAGKHL